MSTDERWTVYDTSCGTWLADGGIEDFEFLRTSDISQATVFDEAFLHSCNQASWEFSIYKTSFCAVRLNGNCEPQDCDTVSTTLANLRERRQDVFA